MPFASYMSNGNSCRKPTSTTYTSEKTPCSRTLCCLMTPGISTPPLDQLALILTEHLVDKGSHIVADLVEILPAKQ